MEAKKFGARLKELREKVGLSQSGLANKVGVNFTYLNKIESGVRPPPSEKIILRLAEVLDADRDELMTLAGRVPSDIAEMLKDRENLQSLRSGRARKKSRRGNKKDGFNTRLRDLREKAGLSQRELANKVGVNFTYLSKIESGVMPAPSERVILRLAEVLDADRDELMTLAGKIPSDIVQMLKNQENLQFLRSGDTQKKMGAATENGGINMMRYLAKYKRLSRVALAIVLVCAVAASLWFTSPSPIRALDIAITDPQGASLDNGTLGQTYYFQVSVSLEDYERLPIQSVDLSIFNSANATYKVSVTGLPLINGGSANYTDAQTGGGGTVNITANATVWNQLSGYSYVVWGGYTYQGGQGLVYTGNITYSIAWTPPVGWPEGGYKIEAKITADSLVFTQVSSEFILAAAGATVEVSVVLEGPSRPDPAGWEIPITVEFFSPGDDVMTAIPVYSFNQATVKSDGTATVNVIDIMAGTYDITVVSEHTLLNVQTNVVITTPSTAVDMGTLIEGNADNSGQVNLLDFGQLKASFMKSDGQEGYNAMADFDRNGQVTMLDFGLLKANFMKFSPITVP